MIMSAARAAHPYSGPFSRKYGHAENVQGITIEVKTDAEDPGLCDVTFTLESS